MKEFKEYSFKNLAPEESANVNLLSDILNEIRKDKFEAIQHHKFDQVPAFRKREKKIISRINNIVEKHVA